jgi:hypothetical protein
MRLPTAAATNSSGDMTHDEHYGLCMCFDTSIAPSIAINLVSIAGVVVAVTDTAGGGIDAIVDDGTGLLRVCVSGASVACLRARGDGGINIGTLLECVGAVVAGTDVNDADDANLRASTGGDGTTRKIRRHVVATAVAAGAVRMNEALHWLQSIAAYPHASLPPSSTLSSSSTSSSSSSPSSELPVKPQWRQRRSVAFAADARGVTVQRVALAPPGQLSQTSAASAAAASSTAAHQNAIVASVTALPSAGSVVGDIRAVLRHSSSGFTFEQLSAIFRARGVASHEWRAALDALVGDCAVYRRGDVYRLL